LSQSPRSNRLFSDFACRCAALLALTGIALPAQAATFFDLVLTPESTWIPTGGAPGPVFGMLRIGIDDLAAAGATSLRIVSLDVTGGGVSVRLDDTIASPGSGVRFPDGSVVIPTLFVIVDAGADPVELAIPDVEGTTSFDERLDLVLETNFAIATEGPAGVVTIDLVAVPEPSGGRIAGLALLLLAAIKKGASDRGAGGRGV
jgi:hypothetical protein